MSVNQQDEEGNTPLHDAVFAQDLDLVISLLNQGANPNIQNFEEDTPLHVAIFVMNHEITLQLLKSGANPNIKDIQGRTALYLLLTEFPVTEEVWVADLNVLLLDLLQYGANPNTLDDSGYSPLHSAILTNNIQTVQLLLDFKADPNVEDKDGNGALFFAIYQGNSDIAALLIKYGAKNIQGKFLKTPLDWAKFYNMSELVKMLTPLPIIYRKPIAIPVCGRSSSYIVV